MHLIYYNIIHINLRDVKTVVSVKEQVLIGCQDLFCSRDGWFGVADKVGHWSFEGKQCFQIANFMC